MSKTIPADKRVGSLDLKSSKISTIFRFTRFAAENWVDDLYAFYRPVLFHNRSTRNLRNCSIAFLVISCSGCKATPTINFTRHQTFLRVLLSSSIVPLILHTLRDYVQFLFSKLFFNRARTVNRLRYNQLQTILKESKVLLQVLQFEKTQVEIPPLTSQLPSLL